MFTWRSPDLQTIIWPPPDPYLALNSSLQLKKSCMVVGGWANPLQTLPVQTWLFVNLSRSWPGSERGPWAWQFYILQPHKTVNTPSLPSDTLDKAIENIKYLDNVTDEMRIRRTKEKNSPGLGLIFLSTAIRLIKWAWYVVYSVVGENIKSLF